MAVTASDVRALLGIDGTDWTDAQIEGTVFLVAADLWLTERLSIAGGTYASMDATDQGYADQAKIHWTAAKIAHTEELRAAREGSSFRAGPMGVSVTSPTVWASVRKRLLDDASNWLEKTGAAMEDRGGGFMFSRGKFGDRSEHPLYTIPDDLIAITPDSMLVEE